MLRDGPIKNPLSETVKLTTGVRALPVIHGSLEFTVLIRELFMHTPPAMVALELPEILQPTLSGLYKYAEQIPVIEIEGAQDGEKNYFIMEPLEPLVEGLWSALEKNIPCHLIDSAVEPVQIWLPENFPDTFSLRFMTALDLYKIYFRSLVTREKSELDLLIEKIDYQRELHMARRIRSLLQFLPGGDDFKDGLLVICGFRHIPLLQRLLNQSDEEFDNENLSVVSGKSELQALDVDNDLLLEEPLESLLNKADAGDSNEMRMSVTLLSRKSPEVLEQPAYFNTAWTIMRKNMKAVRHFNRIALQRSAYRDTVNRYERESGELVLRQNEKKYFRFTRNWSIVEHRLLPDIYRLVVAARGFVNDNFARLMFETLSFLPPLPPSSLPEKKLSLDEIHRDSRLIKFRMKYKIKRKIPPPQIMRNLKREKYPGEWRDAWQGDGICSYPPEDIQIEEFGRYLQNQSRALIQSSENKTIPFTASLMDGVDYRETIRNFHLDRVFVKDLQTRGYDVGSVVVIFSEDISEFDWQVVWWGEHDQESDMAFYATTPGTQMAGPGICRCRYGGFLLAYPPGRLHDIWQDEFYEEFTNPADRLLAAALEYNEKNAVVHLSQRRPHPRLVTIAGRMGQKIIHLPLGSISSVQLGRVQRFHVLDSRGRRDDAGDFIW